MFYKGLKKIVIAVLVVHLATAVFAELDSEPVADSAFSSVLTVSDVGAVKEPGIQSTPRRDEKIRAHADRLSRKRQAKAEQGSEAGSTAGIVMGVFSGLAGVIKSIAFVSGCFLVFLFIMQASNYRNNPKSTTISHLVMILIAALCLFAVPYLPFLDWGVPDYIG